MFRHFILTRYNFGLYTENVYNVQDKDKYMTERLPMFKRLLDSLDNQTEQNFTHVVSVDPNTPEQYLRGILNAVYFSKTQPVIIYEKHIDWLKRQHKSHGYLITSRLDSDDEYYPEFIEVIQRNFKEERFVLDTVGHKCKNGNFSRIEAPYNNSSFVTLIEPWTEGFKTVFTGNGHINLPKYYKCKRVDTDKPLHVRHVHGTNVFYK